MIAAVILLGLIALVFLEPLYWLTLAALFWAPALAIGAMAAQLTQRWTSDPATVLGAGVVAALVARLLTGQLRDYLARATGG